MTDRSTKVGGGSGDSRTFWPDSAISAGTSLAPPVAEERAVPMEMTKTAIGVLAALCVAIGGAAVHFATRGDARPPAVEQPAALSPDMTGLGVEQSEGLVEDNARTTVDPQTTPIERRAERPRSVSPAKPRRAAGRSAQSVTPSVENTPAALPRTESAVVAPALELASIPEPERVQALEPPPPQFEELIVSEDSVVGLEIETAITSEQARVEDEVVAHVTRDVRVGDRVAIPAGARAHGEVTLVERGGRLKDRARLGVRFTSVVLADGTRLPLETETVYREGSAPSAKSTAKIGGGAIGGAIIGGILGGARGAVIGGSAGAGAGTAAVLAGGRSPASFPSGTPLTVRLIEPTTVTVAK
jgi:hypothetical protein